MKSTSWIIAVVSLIGLGASAVQLEAKRPVSYSREVKPFLEKNCAPCHYGGQNQGGLSLTSVSRILKGGNKGPAIVPGKASASRLILLMEHKAEPRMPPIPGAKPLDTRLLRAWIDAGVKDDTPNPLKTDDEKRKTKNESPTPQRPIDPTTLRPNDPRITAAAFSPDGRYLAVGGFRVATVIAAGSGRILGKLEGHTGAVTSLAFSPDGSLLAAGGGAAGKGGEIRIWDGSAFGRAGPWSSKQAGQVRAGHGDAIYALAFSPNGRWIGASSYDQQVSLWPLSRRPNDQTTQGPRFLKDHTDAVYGIAFSPDSKLVATASGDRTVKVWSVQTGKRLFTLSESTAELYSVAFSPTGNQIAAGGVDKTLRTWSISPTGGKLTKAAFAHEAPILRVMYSRDGKSIFTSGEDRMVKRWDAATLAEKKAYPKQPDWPHAIALSPNDKLLAVGRHDGSLAIYDAESGRLLREPLTGPALAQRSAEVPTTSLMPGRRPGDNRRTPRKNGPITLTAASLSAVSPVGVQRGKSVRITLTGANINDATTVFFDDSAIHGKIVSPPDSNKGVLRVDVAVGESARIGIHRVFVQAPRGTTGSATFAVGGWPEVSQAEPNDTPDRAQKLSLPATAIGAMDQPGDVDSYSFEAKDRQEVVFEVIAQPIRSRLQPVMTLLDPAGNTVAESRTVAGKTETLIGHRCQAGGIYTLQIRDFEGASGGDVHYRLNAGEFPVITELFPLGVQKATTGSVTVKGFNLGNKMTASASAPSVTSWGRTTDLQLDTPAGRLLYPAKLAVGEDPETLARGSNVTTTSAQSVAVPVTINGRLTPNAQSPAPNARVSHFFRFPARKGETLILEVQARRLGSRLDSEIEVLDSKGNAVDRAVLRAVGQTEMVLNDRDSASGGLRLQAWDDFRINDFFLVGREVIQLLRLPAGPDEDVFFRTYRGQRLGYLGTTPEFHSLGDPVYKVEIHPPGSTFSPNGFPLRKVFYRNDDGGPLYGKDSYLEFTPPADGEYVVRLSDPRGQSGDDFPYRLMIHPPRPDFRLSLTPEHFNIPRDGRTVVEVSCERHDGFSGDIDVRVEGLPAGFTATSTAIESGETSAFLLVSANPGAVTPMLPNPSPIRVVGRARVGGREIVRAIEPDNGARALTVLPAPDIKVATDVREIVIRPGQEVYVEATVERQGEFGNRVPVIVQNLPFGVRVTDIGLNGVLITEEEESRRFTIYAEPWVKPQTRTFYVSGNVEGGVPNSALPLTIKIEPARAVKSRAIVSNR